MTIASFSDFDLNSSLLANIEGMGFTVPTEIQAQAIPVLLEGGDIIGQAQTGTGKTAAFGLPLLNKITPKDKFVQALVLAPTRELAQQVGEALAKYNGDRGNKVLVVYGGAPYQKQLAGLRGGAQIVVGTPGRLLDLLRNGALKLDRLSTLVLDEADEMLSMGFIDDIEEVMAATPADRQTMLFSATLSSRVMKISNRYLNKPQSISVTPTQMTASKIEQRYYLVNKQDKVAAIARLFEVEPIDSAIIFTRTRLSTSELANELIGRGFAAESLSGDLSQEARTRVLARFKAGAIKVLVATDVAARGLDIDDISHVFNFDLPEDPEVYVHRIGRTGRAGREGTAISLVTVRDRWMHRRVEQYTGKKIAKSELPTIEAIEEHRRQELFERLDVWIRRGRCRNEREIVEQLVAEHGHDPLDIAAAALKIIRKDENKRPIEPIRPVVEETSRGGRNDRYGRDSRGGRNDRGRGGRDSRGGRNDRGSDRGDSFKGKRREAAAPRVEDKDMVPLTLDVGKNDGVAVNHIVASLSHFAGISSRELGKIRINDKFSSVDVPKTLVDKMLSHNGSYRISKKPVNISQR